ncbi:N,N'-diacetylbacillosaminyl-diphospho-undecaprenol alpha-1,3-N-acetylgalactosaminyltransferase [Microbulbifer sp. NBRC 101763]|uniref:glycosyltransferase family 4 protein n=1 Tax=unclassified Microbulbifer TaxID=2619833 RepID=UPI0030A8ED02
MKKRLLFVVNDAAFFISHRLPIALNAKRYGYEVSIASMPGPAVDEIVKYGFAHFELPLTRSGKNPLSDFKLIFSIYKLYRHWRPDLVHLVTIKPVIYGGIVARLAGVHGVVAAVSGLGSIFIARGIKASLVRMSVKWLYRLSFGKKNLRVIFQNPDDRDMLLDFAGLDCDKVEMIRGAGVNLAHYPVMPESDGPLTVSLAARLLVDKGVGEFMDAVRLLKQRDVKARFYLIGDTDPGNPTSISHETLNKWRDEDIVELLGFRADIAELFASSHIVVLPSYREGLPKVLLEAAACGRAIVTTDVPGCRHAIEPGISGVLVPVRDPVALADAIQALIGDAKLRRDMGLAGRDLAEREFALEHIVSAHMEVYKKLELSI